MCRLFSLTSREPVSPMRAIEALDVMREGHDGSGVGLYLHGLSGPLAEYAPYPILSGIFTANGIERMENFMRSKGYTPSLSLPVIPTGTPPQGTPLRHTYLIQAFIPPDGWRNWDQLEQEQHMVQTRLELRRMGIEHEDITVFSFWPDTAVIKEIGDPLHVGQYLQLDREDFHAKIVLAQGRQNTNYAINLYACHPFFLQGVCTMTNGENTAFIPIREYLSSQGVLGYEGYQSDSEVFAHILHYTTKHLGLGLDAYKHIITPLKDQELNEHPDAPFLRRLKQTCRRLIIDGPNCVIGCLPDQTMFMAQDSKKLRPGVVGGKPGLYAFSSEVCGLDAAIPDRDASNDFQPMHLDTAYVGPERKEVSICRQTQPLALQH
ncbi:MAG: glutamate synthase [Thermodesulfobacteriota bacterium]